MDIAQVSMNMSAAKLHQNVSVAVLDMAMESMDDMAQTMVDELILPSVTPSAGMEPPLVDITV